MRKVGILGGTFNPPHIGHLIIANEVFHALDLEEIWFMPNQDPPHKLKEGVVSDHQRVRMLEIMVSEHPNFFVETLEMERQGPSYTYETMQILTERHKDIQFHFIIGADMIEYLPKWHRIEELQELIKFVGVNRPKHCSESDYNILFIEVPSIEISSSLIRQRCKEGGTIRYLVPEPVRKYIEENLLYGP
ncbi:nicotinate-nucleotide adenylyltransferase [Bacillus sp. B15-48]|uniref:nicotinate-nucleotide adenylyltransferase n=1 Tax=Bacillus sp. B15-48 TaxID=1548601 RepID=UPI00193F15BC|nr:nicotinate-nucleotide adenylyltransferase [Bacillus sp. B15-48]MBM4762365.1 nicotinate-nucleotide adenylyltransferase [Bacillus sp. B15-48]